MSAAGEALQMLPASVARLRMGGPPTYPAASARAGQALPSAGWRSRVAMRVNAPMRQPPAGSGVTSSSPGTRLRSTMHAASVWPCSRPSTRSVPPASGRAAAPCSASSRSASVRDCGAW